MIIGVPKEIKVAEKRVAVTPQGVDALVSHQHRVLVEKGAGEGSGFADQDYCEVGATVLGSADQVWNQSDMIYRVKNPIPCEYKFFRRGLVLFCYLHLAANKELTAALMDSGVCAIAFETVELPDGHTPLLDPMSAVAGRIATQEGAHYMEKAQGGCGKLMGGIPGVPPANVVIIGGGVVGANAAEAALALGARVTVIDKNLTRLSYLEERFACRGRFETLTSDIHNITDALRDADLLIGAVLVKGSKAPIVVTREMIRLMKPGSVAVDVAVDQGGCIETSRPTSHDHPVYVVDGVIHYCVNNMPGIVPRTSSVALANATSGYALKLANLGFLEAMNADGALAKGLNVYDGKVTNQFVAESLGLPYLLLEQAVRHSCIA